MLFVSEESEWLTIVRVPAAAWKDTLQIERQRSAGWNGDPLVKDQ